MTPTKRIFLNVVATYGRSLYMMLVGLFVSRWVLMSLGDVDYGLFSLVGGLIGFVAFFNNILSEAVSRFYAYSVGAGHKAVEKGPSIKECQKWFSIAICIHSILPTVLVCIGYPLGLWAVRSFLAIPNERIVACEWVWLFSCISCYIGMISVPFLAMYNAKQEIAELTIYSFVTATVNIGVVYFMTTQSRDWLAIYSCWMMLLGVIPNIIIDIRAMLKYKECRFCLTGVRDFASWKNLLGYSSARFFGAISQLLTSQGMAIVVNKLLGPAKNAAMAVGGNLNSKTSLLCISFRGALTPAITNAAGCNDLIRMRSLMLRTCLLCGLSFLAFAVPMIVEADEVMTLWLRCPPAGSASLCRALVAATFVDQMTMGLAMGILAKGKIFAFQALEGAVWIFALFIAGLWMYCGGDILGVGIGYLIMHMINTFQKLYFAQKHCGISIRKWLRTIGIPLAGVALVVLCAAWVPRLYMKQSFTRLSCTTIIAELIFALLVWNKVLADQEKIYLRNKFYAIFFHNHSSL